jgi:hypothetical protein
VKDNFQQRKGGKEAERNVMIESNHLIPRYSVSATQVVEMA